VFK
jgi:hypothetical protein